MADYGIPIGFAVFVWWFSTGIVLYVVGLPPRMRAMTLLVASVLLAVSIYGLVATSDDPSVSGVFVAFVCTIVAWGWVEVTFLTGVLTGPRPLPCPEGARGWQRTLYAIRAILYHELALLGVGALVVLSTVGAVNQIGVWTYLLLWVLRLSAKLNLFLGVPVLNAGLLPRNLGFIKSYFREGPVNLLFPVSVTLGTIATALLAGWASAEATTPALRSGYMLLAALMALAVLEHWFMVIQAPLTAAWGWSLKSPERTAPVATADDVKADDFRTKRLAANPSREPARSMPSHAFLRSASVTAPAAHAGGKKRS
jgi:putative photosynthetic complex assembly protein 2